MQERDRVSSFAGSRGVDINQNAINLVKSPHSAESLEKSPLKKRMLTKHSRRFEKVQKEPAGGGCPGELPNLEGPAEGTRHAKGGKGFQITDQNGILKLSGGRQKRLMEGPQKGGKTQNNRKNHPFDSRSQTKTTNGYF